MTFEWTYFLFQKQTNDTSARNTKTQINMITKNKTLFIASMTIYNQLCFQHPVSMKCQYNLCFFFSILHASLCKTRQNLVANTVLLSRKKTKNMKFVTTKQKHRIRNFTFWAIMCKKNCKIKRKGSENKRPIYWITRKRLVFCLFFLLFSFILLRFLSLLCSSRFWLIFWKSVFPPIWMLVVSSGSYWYVFANILSFSVH